MALGRIELCINGLSCLLANQRGCNCSSNLPPNLSVVLNSWKRPLMLNYLRPVEVPWNMEKSFVRLCWMYRGFLAKLSVFPLFCISKLKLKILRMAKLKRLVGKIFLCLIVCQSWFISQGCKLPSAPPLLVVAVLAKAPLGTLAPAKMSFYWYGSTWGLAGAASQNSASMGSAGAHCLFPANSFLVSGSSVWMKSFTEPVRRLLVFPWKSHNYWH